MSSMNNANKNSNNNNNNNEPRTSLDGGTYGTTKVETNNAKCWHIAYYQSHFDIDTYTELRRLKKAMLPFLNRSEFFDAELNEKPDLFSFYFLFLFFLRKIAIFFLLCHFKQNKTK